MHTHDEVETAEQLKPEVTCSHQVWWDTFSSVPCETNTAHETFSCSVVQPKFHCIYRYLTLDIDGILYCANFIS